ncbi:hypothetical protein D9M68_339010 [compost metagenome]
MAARGLDVLHAAGEEEGVDRVAAGGAQVAGILHLARAQRVDMRHLGQQRQLQQYVREPDHAAAFERGAHQRNKVGGRHVARGGGGHHRGQRALVVWQDRAREHLALDRLDHGLHARERRVAVDHQAGAQRHHQQLVALAQDLMVLAHHDLERLAAVVAQLVHLAGQSLELGDLPVVQHHGGRDRTGGGGHRGGIVVDHLPVRGDPALAQHGCAADDDAVLVGGQQRGCLARRDGVVGAAAGHQAPVHRREAQRHHLGRQDRVLVAPEADFPDELPVLLRQPRHAREMPVEPRQRRQLQRLRAAGRRHHQQHAAAVACAPSCQQLAVIGQRDRVVPAEIPLRTFHQELAALRAALVHHGLQRFGQHRDAGAAGHAAQRADVGARMQRARAFHVEAVRAQHVGDPGRLARGQHRGARAQQPCRALPEQRVAGGRGVGIDHVHGGGLECRQCRRQRVDGQRRARLQPGARLLARARRGGGVAGVVHCVGEYMAQ